MYVLDTLGANNKRLVKKIEVTGFEVKNLRSGKTLSLFFIDEVAKYRQPVRSWSIQILYYHILFFFEIFTFHCNCGIISKGTGWQYPVLKQYLVNHFQTILRGEIDAENIHPFF